MWHLVAISVIKLNFFLPIDYDEKKNINKRKKLIMKGLDPEEVEREKKKAWKQKMKNRKKNLNKSKS